MLEIFKIHLSTFNCENLSEYDFTELGLLCYSYEFTGSDVRLVVEHLVKNMMDEICGNGDLDFHDQDMNQNFLDLK